MLCITLFLLFPCIFSKATKNADDLAIDKFVINSTLEPTDTPTSKTMISKDVLVFEDVSFQPRERGVRIGIPFTTSMEEIQEAAKIINKEIYKLNKNSNPDEYSHLFINVEDCETDNCQNNGFIYKFGKNDGSECGKCACRQIPDGDKLRIFYDSDTKCKLEQTVTFDSTRTEVSGDDRSSYYHLDQVQNGYIAAIVGSIISN